MDAHLLPHAGTFLPSESMAEAADTAEFTLTAPVGRPRCEAQRGLAGLVGEPAARRRGRVIAVTVQACGSPGLTLTLAPD